jgi:hypothetical protein
MLSKKLLFSVILAVFTVLLLEQCKHMPSEEVLPIGINTNPGNNPGVTTPKDTLCFSSDILPLIISTCAKPTCHDAISHVEGLNLTNYASIMRFVKSGNATGSQLYRYCKNGSYEMNSPTQSLTVLDTASLNKLAKWINSGAINSICNNCDTGSATVPVKFSTHVFPIIQQNCLGCHTAGTTTLLNNYAQVQAQVTNGLLYCAVSQTGACNPMPQGGAKLDACKVRAIKIWIDAGALNN